MKYDKVSEWLEKLLTSLNSVSTEPSEKPIFPHAIQLPKHADENTLLTALKIIKSQSEDLMDEIKEERADLQQKVGKVAPKFTEVLEQLDSKTLHKITRIDPTLFEEDENEDKSSVIDEELLKEQKLEESELRKEAKQRKEKSNEAREAARKAKRAAALRRGEEYVPDESVDF